MLSKVSDATLCSLAKIIAEKQVNLQSIRQALELVCDGFSFDGGVLYENDFFEHFCVAELFVSESNTGFTVDSIQKSLLQGRPDWNAGAVKWIARSGQLDSWEQNLLEHHRAERLVAVPVLDEQAELQGVIVLFGAQAEPALDSEQLSELALVLALLVRYVDARACRRRDAQVQGLLVNILDHSNIDIYVNDFYTHEILYTNQSMAAPYGGVERLKGHPCWRVLFPGQSGPCSFCPQTKLIDEDGVPSKVYSWDYQRPFDGAWFRVFSSAFRWVDGRLVHLVSSADISENKRNEALVEYLANYDPLTSLPNRRMLVRECEQRISRATATEHGYVLFFDIDGFKAINDRLGHDAGDEFLIQLGAFFTGIPLLKDSTYRNGGDEFVAIIGGEEITREHIISLVGFVHERFKRVWHLKRGEVTCSTSVGVACFPEDGVTTEALLQEADRAMYLVKNRGGQGMQFADAPA